VTAVRTWGAHFEPHFASASEMDIFAWINIFGVDPWDVRQSTNAARKSGHFPRASNFPFAEFK
jgi:hypothetical protein